MRAALMRLFSRFVVLRRSDHLRAELAADERELAERLTAAVSADLEGQAVEVSDEFAVYGEARPEATTDLGEAWQPIFRKNRST